MQIQAPRRVSISGRWQERPLPPSRCRLYKYSYVRLVLFTAFLHAEREAG